MHKHELVERSILNYRLLTGPLRLLARKTPPTPNKDLSEDMRAQMRAAEEADALSPFIPDMKF
jgi:hypothetical protein